MLAAGFFVITGFVSCDNFMKGGDVRDEIKDAIEYNNALTCTVLLKSDSDKGEFLTVSSNSFKIGYESEVQFSVNQDLYVFKDLEAKCVSDETKDYKDIVEIKLSKADEKKGLYTYIVKPLLKVDDLMIYPICVLIPDVETSKIKPAFESSGCDQDSSINIVFNKPVDPESFDDYSCISISDDNGDDIWNCFTTPYFSEDKKTLVIPANLEKLILPPDGSKNTMVVRVRYDFSEQKDCDGILINQTGTHEYKINKNFGNQKKVNVLVDTDTTQGKFLSSGEKECTVGYTIEVQFTVKKADYKFIGFEAVSSQTNHESRADSVTIEDKDFDDDNGVYKARVRVIKEQNDILIRPVCKILPKITDVSPKLEYSGCNQDTKIQITFNKPVKPESFKDEDGNFKCISIFSDEGDLLQKFGTPYFSNDNKTLYISPEDLFLPPDESKNLLSIQIDYDFTKVLDEDGLEFAAKGTHTYRVNKTFSEQVPVVVQVPQSSYGQILSAGSRNCIVGYTTDLQFTVDKKNYRFVRFEAVSSKDNTTSRDGSVTFEESTNDDENGIYWAKVRINKDDSDILIRPVCAELPAVSNVATSAENFVNYSFVITLTQPINASTLNNLSIKYNGTEYNTTQGTYHLFNTPVYDSSKKTITIKPKMLDLKNFIETLRVTSIDFQVTLPDTITGSSDGVTLPLKQNDKSSFTVRYKAEIDSTPPVKNDFFVTRKPITLATAKNVSADDKFLIQTFEDDYDKALQNLNNGTIYIYGKYYDKYNTIKNVVVQSRDTNSGYLKYEIVYDADSENIEFSTDGNGYTEFCIKHVTTDLDKDRCNLRCYVKNALDYESAPVNFTMYKDDLDLSDILFYNFVWDDMEEGAFDIDWFNGNYKTIKISYDPEFDDDHSLCSVGWYLDDDDLCDYYDSYLFECEYKDDDGVTRVLTMQNDKTEKCLYCHLQNVESVNGLKFLLKGTDRIQTHSEKELEFPEATGLGSITQNGSSATITFTPGKPSFTTFMERNELLLEEYDGEYELTDLGTNFGSCSHEINTSSSYKYYTIPGYCSQQGNVYLCGDISAQINTDPAATNNIPNVQLNGNPTYKKGRSWFGGTSVGNIDYMDITVKIAQDSWENFDKIYVAYVNANGNNSMSFFNENECSITFERKVEQLYEGDTVIKVYGVKDNVRSSGTIYTIPQLESSSTCDYDYRKPTLEVTRIDYDTFKVQLTDDESGPDYGYVLDILKSNGDYKYKLNSSNEWTVYVPVWELLDVRNTYGQAYALKAEGYDKAGNMDETNDVRAVSGYVYRGSSPYKWHYKYYSGAGTNTFVFYTRHSQSVNLYKLNTSNGLWILDKEKLSKGTKYTDASTGADGIYYKYTYSNPPEDSFIRVVGVSNLGYWNETSCPSYFYTGTQNSGDYDLMIPNGGNSQTEFAVSSDSAVFVHTIVTKRPECKDWVVYDWEDFRKHIGEKQFSFSSTDHSPKRYVVPIDQIKSGEYYVVIAHFADGSVTMSQVMEKK